MQKIVSLGLTREPRARRQCHARSTFKDRAPTPLDITPGSVVREGPPGFVYRDWRGEAPFYRTRIGQPRPASELPMEREIREPCVWQWQSHVGLDTPTSRDSDPCTAEHSLLASAEIPKSALIKTTQVRMREARLLDWLCLTWDQDLVLA